MHSKVSSTFPPQKLMTHWSTLRNAGWGVKAWVGQTVQIIFGVVHDRGFEQIMQTEGNLCRSGTGRLHTCAWKETDKHMNKDRQTN